MSFLLKGPSSCQFGDRCFRLHLAPESEAARVLPLIDANPTPRGCISVRSLTSAISSAPKELMLRFFDAWGTQMDHIMISSIWNKLGQQLRDDRGREAWVAANGEVLARLRRRSVEVLPQCEGQGFANIVPNSQKEEPSTILTKLSHRCRLCKCCRKQKVGFAFTLV